MGAGGLLPNRRRGEITAMFDGQTRILCLTLGALAELESAFGVDNLAELGARFSAGRLSARDIIAIVGAGLRGAGNLASDEDVGQMSTEGGLSGMARIAAELLVATFGTSGGQEAKPPEGKGAETGELPDPLVPQAE